MHYKQVQANRGNTSIHSFYVYKRECMKINMLHTDLANMSCKKTSPLAQEGCCRLQPLNFSNKHNNIRKIYKLKATLQF